MKSHKAKSIDGGTNCRLGTGGEKKKLRRSTIIGIEQLSEKLQGEDRALEERIKEIEESGRTKDATVKTLEQELNTKIKELEFQEKSKERLVAERDNQINGLKSEVALLSKGIKEMSSFFKQAEGLMGIQAQDILADLKSPHDANTAAAKTSKPAPVAEKPAATATEKPAMPAVEKTAAPQTAVLRRSCRYSHPLNPTAALTRNFLTQCQGVDELWGQAAVSHSTSPSLKESMANFLKRAREVDLVVREIPDEKQKSKLRERLSHLLVAGNPGSQSLKTVAR